MREEFARAARTSFRMVKIAAVLAFVMLSAAPAAAVPTVAAHTNAVIFNATSMRVTARQSGNCWTASIASQRSDAYRCMVGNAIHDPCFELSAQSVACPLDAAENSGLVIALDKPLPPAASHANAWQMQLVSGATCAVGTGTTIPGYPFYCTQNLVCSAPPPGPPPAAVFVRCAAMTNGTPGKAGSYLVTTLYQ